MRCIAELEGDIHAAHIGGTAGSGKRCHERAVDANPGPDHHASQVAACSSSSHRALGAPRTACT
jgi:hypothetical protein